MNAFYSNIVQVLKKTLNFLCNFTEYIGDHHIYSDGYFKHGYVFLKLLLKYQKTFLDKYVSYNS